MKLKELLNEIKRKFMVDEILKAYLYNDKIELVDYTGAVSLSDGTELKDHYGNLGVIYLDSSKNSISMFENNCIHLITPANKEIVTYMSSLIGLIIEDYEDYDKLPEIDKLSSLDI